MTTTESFTLERLDGTEARRCRDEVLKVYAGAMMAPPYEKSLADVQLFAGIYERHTRRGGFRLVAARRAGELVGYAYGYLSSPGGWWRDQVADALGPEAAREWLSDAFELTELAVAPARQRAGLGSSLHDALLDGVTARTSVLSTLKEDTAGSRLYVKKGWRTLVDEFWFTGTPAPYRVMGLRLSSKP